MSTAPDLNWYGLSVKFPEDFCVSPEAWNFFTLALRFMTMLRNCSNIDCNFHLTTLMWWLLWKIFTQSSGVAFLSVLQSKTFLLTIYCMPLARSAKSGKDPKSVGRFTGRVASLTRLVKVPNQKSNHCDDTWQTRMPSTRSALISDSVSVPAERNLFYLPSLSQFVI